MKVEYIEETSVRKALTFEVPSDLVTAEIDKRAKELARKVKLPGFRPGKTPLEVIKKRFRDDILGEAAEAIVNKVVFDELEGRGLRPISAPKVEEVKLEEGQPLTFKAVFETLPIIELPDWKGLEVKVKNVAVSDEDVERELTRLREEAARFEPVEDSRPTQQGDYVLLDVTWQPLDGGKGGHDENALLEIGNAGNHEAMNAGLAGMSLGETKEIEVAWGADAAPAVANKTVRYTVSSQGHQEEGRAGSGRRLREGPRRVREPGAAARQAARQLETADRRRLDRETKAGLIEALVARVRLRGARGAHRAAHDRPHREPRPRAGLPGHRPQQGGRELERVPGVDTRGVGEGRPGRHPAQRDRPARTASRCSNRRSTAEVARIAERAGKPKEQVRAQLAKEGDLGALASRIREEKTLDLLKANASIELT